MFEHDWQPAEATIVEERPLTNWSRTVGGNYTVPREYVADVRPEGQAPFRATFHEPLTHGHYDHPRPGDVVNVLFNPKSHKVKLSPEYKVSPGAAGREKAEQFQAVADAAPGTQAASGAPETVRFTADGGRTIPAPTSSAAEQLTKLADLHDRGALSDAEFASEKAKILAQG